MFKVNIKNLCNNATIECISQHDYIYVLFFLLFVCLAQWGPAFLAFQACHKLSSMPSPSATPVSFPCLICCSALCCLLSPQTAVRQTVCPCHLWHVLQLGTCIVLGVMKGKKMNTLVQEL